MTKRAEWVISPMGRSSMLDVGPLHVETWQSAVTLKWHWSKGPNFRLRGDPFDSMDAAQADAVRWLRATIAEMAAMLPPEHSTATALAIDLIRPPTPIVECYRHPDWFQLRAVYGRTNLEHRWRHHKAAGWSTWRPLTSAADRGLSDRPGRIVPEASADLDPASRGPVSGEMAAMCPEVE